MKITRNELRDIIKLEIIKEMSEIKESDLIAKNQESWKIMKNKFSKDIITLLQNIENDEYDDAEDKISEVIGILKFWQSRIGKGKEDKPFTSVLGEDGE